MSPASGRRLNLLASTPHYHHKHHHQCYEYAHTIQQCPHAVQAAISTYHHEFTASGPIGSWREHCTANWEDTQHHTYCTWFRQTYTVHALLSPRKGSGKLEGGMYTGDMSWLTQIQFNCNCWACSNNYQSLHIASIYTMYELVLHFVKCEAQYFTVFDVSWGVWYKFSTIQLGNKQYKTSMCY